MLGGLAIIAIVCSIIGVAVFKRKNMSLKILEHIKQIPKRAKCKIYTPILIEIYTKISNLSGNIICEHIIPSPVQNKINTNILDTITNISVVHTVVRFTPLLSK